MSGPVSYDQPPLPAGAVGYPPHARQNAGYPSASTSSSLSMSSSTSSSLGGLGGPSPSSAPGHQPTLITPQMQHMQVSGSHPGSAPPQLMHMNGQYLPHGEPSMRPSVDGIPQLHVASAGQTMIQPIAVPQVYYDAHAPQPGADFRFGAVPSSMPAPQGQVVGNVIGGSMPIGMEMGAGGPPVSSGGMEMGMGMGMNMGGAGMGMGGMGGMSGMPGQPGMGMGMAPGVGMGLNMGGAGIAVDGWGGEWEDDFDEGQGPMFYGNLEVKHRRRTTPEQLRVLEHWFSVNPRPDNALREWLANELGITKRNVQVWFQNRRAKIKNQEKAREAAAAEAARTDGGPDSATTASSSGTAGAGSGSKSDGPSPTMSSGPPSASPLAQSRPNTAGAADRLSSSYTPSSHFASYSPSSTIQGNPGANNHVGMSPSSYMGTTPSAQPLLAVADNVNMGRRVSLAGGEAAMIEQWAMKRAAAGAKRQAAMAGVGGVHIPGAYQMPGSTASANSPMGMAAAARRGSQPYPSPIVTHLTEDGQFAIGPGPRTALPTMGAPSFTVSAAPSSSGGGSGSPSASPSATVSSGAQMTPTPGSSGGGAMAPSPSPKVSPNGRMPSALHFTAMRNNTIRRASMPGVAQLVSTTAFTPPRNASGNHPVPGASVGTNAAGAGGRELSPIRDHEHSDDRPDAEGNLSHLSQQPSVHTEFSTSYLTPPSSTYMSSDGSRMSSNHNPDSAGSNNSFDFGPAAAAAAAASGPAGINPNAYNMANAYAFSPNSPLPNPGFSFGSAASMPPSVGVDNGYGGGVGGGVGGDDDAANQAQALWMALQRGRLGSIASIASAHTVTTEGGTTEAGSVGGDVPGPLVDWTNLLPPGFDPDLRRASAPADLLHNMGVLGISGSSGSSHMHLSTGGAGGEGGMPPNSAGSAGPGQGPGLASLHRPSPLATAYSQPVIDRGVPLTAPVPVGLPSVYLQQRSAQQQQQQQYDDQLSSPLHPHHGHSQHLSHPGLSPLSNPGSGVSSENPSPSSHHTQPGTGVSLMPPPPLPSRSHSMYAQPGGGGAGGPGGVPGDKSGSAAFAQHGGGPGGFGMYNSLSQGHPGLQDGAMFAHPQPFGIEEGFEDAVGAGTKTDDGVNVAV